MIVKLKKITELPDARHPNNIIVGFEKEGKFIDIPKIGDNFYVGYFWRTSRVQEIIDDHTFKTLSSIYYWEIIPDEPNSTVQK